MKLNKITGLGLAAALLAGTSAHAASLDLKHIVAKVVVVPEARSDVAVTVIKANPKLPLRVRNEADGVTVVDGGERDWWPMLFGGHISHCRVGPEGTSVHVAGVGDFSEDQLPQLLVRVPMDARISTSGAIVGSLPAAQTLDLSIAGCDTWTIGDIKGRMHLSEAGQGRIRTGALGSADIDIAGTATVTTRAIADELKVSISGAGDLYSSSASGQIAMSIAGKGQMRIDGGHVSSLKGSIAGNGDLTYEGAVDRVKISVAGKGSVHVAHVAGMTGPLNQGIMGVGEIDEGR
ncbi:MAG TPA: DUF2807 domain-containing protein [Caulobacteraceae bacterium]|jgi:hypothetical protein